MNRLLLLATGGTIAGCAENSATLNNYTAGVLGGDALLAAVPQLQDLAAIMWSRSPMSTALICCLPIGVRWWGAFVLPLRQTPSWPGW